jgi:moderate conductance mechanosensitive channel
MDFFNYHQALTWVWDKTDEAAKILFVVIGSFILIRLVRTLADRLLKIVEHDSSSSASERQLRARTLAGIFKGVAKIVIVIVAGITVLDTLGISVAPLLATAGVAGLAISFGAQNLIRDVISGFFILLENQFKVGDVIKAAGVSGRVEDLNLRITVLRDLEGVVHFIPNGEIKVISNLGKEWAQAVVNVGVAYREDLDRVVRILNQAGDELSRDSLYGPNILEPPQVLGIESFEDSQMTLRISTKTKPLKQWETARELRRRIKMAFDREGIEIPFTQRVINSQNSPSQKKSLTAGSTEDAGKKP